MVVPAGRATAPSAAHLCSRFVADRRPAESASRGRMWCGRAAPHSRHRGRQMPGWTTSDSAARSPTSSVPPAMAARACSGQRDEQAPRAGYVRGKRKSGRMPSALLQRNGTPMQLKSGAEHVSFAARGDDCRRGTSLYWTAGPRPSRHSRSRLRGARVRGISVVSAVNASGSDSLLVQELKTVAPRRSTPTTASCRRAGRWQQGRPRRACAP